MTSLAPRAHVQRFRAPPGPELVASRYDPPPGAPRRPPALLLHGGGQTRHAWAMTGARLAREGFRVFAVDQRGHGDSGWADPPAYAYQDFGDDALALADAIALETGARPIVVGASLGGLAAMAALAREPDAFAALLLVDVAPVVKTEGVDAVRGFMLERAGEGFASIEEAGDAVARYLPHRPKPRSLDGLRKNLRERDGRFYWHWDPRFLRGPRSVGSDGDGRPPDFAAALAGARMPVLLVRGRQSELVGEDEVERFRRDFPRAGVVDISGARHMVAGDRNDAFAAAIIAFLTRHFPADRAA